MTDHVKGERRIPGADPNQVRLAAITGDTFAGGGVTLQQDLPYILIFNGDSSAHVFTCNGRGRNNNPNTFTVAAGNTASIPTLPFAGITIDSATSAVTWLYSDVPINPSNAAGSGSAGLFVTVGYGNGCTYVVPAGSVAADVTINAAITAVNAQGGGTVYLINNGTKFSVANTIHLLGNVAVIGQTYSGNPFGATLCIQPTAAFAGSTVFDTSPVSGTNSIGVTLGNVTVDGSLMSTIDFIHVTNVVHGNFFNLTARQFVNGVTFDLSGTPAQPGYCKLDNISLGTMSGTGYSFTGYTQILGNNLYNITGATIAVLFNATTLGCSSIFLNNVQLSGYTTYGIQFTDDGSHQCLDNIVSNVYLNGSLPTDDIFSNCTTAGSLGNLVSVGNCITTSPSYASGNATTVNHSKVFGVRGISDIGLAQANPTATPVSTTRYYNTYGYPVDVHITGGTVSAVEIWDRAANNVTFTVVPVPGTTYRLQPGGSIAITWTVQVTWAWDAVGP